MGEYIISIAVAAVISAVMTMVVPKGWDKYVGIVTGLVVTICIARPIISIMGADFGDVVTYESQSRTVSGAEEYEKQVREQLEERIEKDAQKRLKDEFGLDCTCRCRVEIEADDRVEVACITTYGDKLHTVAKARLREVYGATEVNYGGNKKTAEKSE